MKLIAIDLDGTLLSPHSKITQENLHAVRTAQEQGHIVMICSGRTPEDIDGIIGEAGLSCPVAGSNGAVVRLNGSIIQSISMEQEVVKTITRQLVQEKGIFYELYTNTGIFMPLDWSERIDALDLKDHLPEDIGLIFKRHIDKLYKSGVVTFYEHESDWAQEHVAVHKINMLLDHSAKRSKLQSFLEAFDGIEVTSSESFNLEVMHRDGHKGNGLKCVADYYGIPLEQTIAIGNSYNDIPMFEAAGLSIAMGNSDQEVQDQASVVTLSNAENGVAYALNKYIFQDK